MTKKSDLSILYRQPTQLLFGVISILGFLFFLETSLLTIEGKFWDVDVIFWFWVSILIPIIHQIIIPPLWRSELLKERLTRFFGSTEKAFSFFKVIFATFFIPRMLITVPIAVATRNTVGNELIRLILLIIGILLTPIIFYGLYSVKKYFGIDRAFGGDHFFEEFRELPIVNEGLFKYTNNAMYTFVMAFVLLPGLYLGSYIALIAGIFNHGFVWVHYYTTEKPDMDYIYGDM